MKKIFKTILINFMVFSTLLVIMELLSLLVYSIKTRELPTFRTETEKNKIFEKHPYLVGRLKASIKVIINQKTITTTDHHTRWTGADPDDETLIRVGLFGGSTTFGTKVTDEDSWPALLQQKLGKKYAVINFGVPGYSTVENIIQMALIAPERRPHIVIFYEGWNDIRNYHEKELGVDYFSHGISQYRNLDLSSFNYQDESYLFKDNYAFFWVIDKIKKKIKGRESKELKSPINSIDLFDAPDNFVDSIYIRNLKTLKLLAKNINAYPIFIPQVLNYQKFDTNEGNHHWSKHIKSSAMRDLMSKFNVHMNGLCPKGEKDCMVLNNVLEKNWANSDFVDYGHFSRSGGEKLADMVFQAIDRNFDEKLFGKMKQTTTNKLH